MADRADPDLVAGWLRGRSIARHLPEPVADHGGWRVDTGLETELRRYVFAEPSSELAELARTIDRPKIFLKCCTEDVVLQSFLTPAWRISDATWMMIGPETSARRTSPPGYDVTVTQTGGAIEVHIVAKDGTLAASGYAAETAGAFVYDRIVTSPDHQRRGLGGAVMARLDAERGSGKARRVLVATAEGRALYSALGWRVHAPYATAVLPETAFD